MGTHTFTATLRRLGTRVGLLFTLLTLVGFAACTNAPAAGVPQSGVRVEPSRLIFQPETASIAVELVNTSPNPVFVGGFRIDGPDWESFSIAEPVNPQAIAPGERLTLHVGAEAQSLLGPLPSARAEADPFAPTTADEDAVADDEFRHGEATLRFRAGELAQAVPVRFEDTHWVTDELVPALLKVLLLVMAFIMPMASLLTWMERKQSALMQDRVGPNMARITLGSLTLRLWGLLHIATDGLKLLFKEDFVPRRAHRALYTIAPILALAPALVVFSIVPFGDALCYDQAWDVLQQADVDQCAAGRGGTPLQIAHIDVGLLFYFAIASLATYGTALAGWASYNKWAILGSLRASAQMISYEVAIGLTIVGALLVYGTLEPHALVLAQAETHWGIVLQPLAFVLFFTAAIAETKRAPFDLPEGESEIIGYFLEYSGMRFGLFFLSEFIEIVFVSALVATLFFGGWTLPFGMFGAAGFTDPVWAQLFFLGSGAAIFATGAAIWRASKHAETLAVILILVGSLQASLAVWSVFTGWGTALPHGLVVLIGMVTWGIKVLALCWLQLLIRWTLPRFRYDQLMNLGWKGLLPLSIANIVLTAVVVYFMSAPADEGATALGTRPTPAAIVPASAAPGAPAAIPPREVRP